MHMCVCVCAGMCVHASVCLCECVYWDGGRVDADSIYACRMLSVSKCLCPLESLTLSCNHHPHVLPCVMLMVV